MLFIELQALRVCACVTYDRHSFADVIEVQDGEERVCDSFAELMCGDCARCARAKHKAKVACSCYYRPLIWRLSLIQQLSFRK